MLVLGPESSGFTLPRNLSAPCSVGASLAPRALPSHGSFNVSSLTSSAPGERGESTGDVEYAVIRSNASFVSRCTDVTSADGDRLPTIARRHLLPTLAPQQAPVYIDVLPNSNSYEAILVDEQNTTSSDVTTDPYATDV